MVIETRLSSAPAIFILSVATRGDDYSVPATFFTLNPSGYLVPVDLRKADVQQDHIRRPSQRSLDRIATAMRHGNFVAGQLQKRDQGMCCIYVVFDDKYACFLHGNLRPAHRRSNPCRGSGRRQTNDKFAALFPAPRFSRRCCRLVHLDQFLGNRKPDAETAFRPSRRPVALR